MFPPEDQMRAAVLNPAKMLIFRVELELVQAHLLVEIKSCREMFL